MPIFVPIVFKNAGYGLVRRGNGLERSTLSFSSNVSIAAEHPPRNVAGPGTDIVLDGDKFSYKRTLTTPDGSLVITYTGTVSGDTFMGTVSLGGFAEAPYNGVRFKRPN